MNGAINKKIEHLAEEISRAGRIIAKDSIAKEYNLGEYDKDTIIVRSDSGYEAIYVGNIEGKNKDGYMCLYTNNTSKRNSYPSKDEIIELLMKVLNEERLEEGDGKAAYYDWEDFGCIEKQLKYFSKVVRKMSGLS